MFVVNRLSKSICFTTPDKLQQLLKNCTKGFACGRVAGDVLGTVQHAAALWHVHAAFGREIDKCIKLGSGWPSSDAAS